MKKLKEVAFLLLFVLLCCTLAGCHKPGEPPTRSPDSHLRELTEEPRSESTGLQYTLAEGTGEVEGAEVPAPKAAQLTPLTDEQLSALLRRLPEFTAKSESVDFSLRESSLAPPRTGEKVHQVWPPQQKPPKPDQATSSALQVVRRAPVGEVPLAPQLSLTFNQPMVAVTSVDELAKQKPPVVLTPQPEGTWRWVGTQTLLFDPRGEVSKISEQQARFPMSTEYNVEIPAGTKSATGAALAEPQRWSFQTATVTLTGSSPSGGPHPLEPMIWASFNQDVDPAAVLKTITLQGGDPVGLRLATAEEVVPSGLDPKTAKRWVAFKATAPLKPATTYTVTIGPGTPSAEGPLLTKAAQTFTFSTYHKFAVDKHGCGNGDSCPPLTPLHISFNNPIDTELFDPTMVAVTPKIPNMKVEADGRSLRIRGETKGRTTYKVTLKGSLPDSFGQTLGEKKELSFTIGSAEAQLKAPGELLLTTDPSEPAHLPVYVINESSLKVRIHTVEPKDWKEFQNRLARETEDDRFVPPGQEVFNGSISTGAKTDELTEVKIDLKPALKNGKGMAVVVVETPDRIINWWQRQRVVKWVQVTDIGIDAAVDSQVMSVLTTDLETGSSLSGVSLNLLGENGESGASVLSADGAASLTLPETSHGLLVAEKDGDISILPQNTHYYGGGGWRKSRLSDQLQWFVVDDRKMYRPDEKVSVKGWVRRHQAGPKGDLVALEGELRELKWRLTDTVGNKVLEGSAPVSENGSFQLELKLPKTINLGHADLVLSGSSTLDGNSHYHSFQVQEFRRPEFEVSASVSPDSSLIGSSAMATVSAKYYAGGGLPAAPVDWSASASPGSYSPPGHDGFTFGKWTPWWDLHGWETAPHRAGFSVSSDGSNQRLQGRTDGTGTHHVKLDFLSVDPPSPTVVAIEASVSDVNRQAWSASTSILVHPSDYYIGLRTEETFVKPGEPLEVELIACHRDGRVVKDVPVELAIWRNDYRTEKGRRLTSYEGLQTKTVTSGEKPVTVSLPTGAGGTYTVKARIIDPEGRANESSLTVWVAGGEQPAAQNLEQQQLTLIPNKKEYKVGEVAEILVQAPFSPSEGQVTWRRSGIVKTERVSLKEGSTVLKVPIEEGFVPNLTVAVTLNGVANTASGKKQPAYASGQIQLSVPPLSRTLAVEVKPLHPSAEPGAKTGIEVSVTGSEGEPVEGAEVALFAVDEAVLALAGYQFPNPLDTFYAPRRSDVSDVHSRQYVVLTKLEKAIDERFDDSKGFDIDSGAEFAQYESVAGAPGGVASEQAPLPSSVVARRELKSEPRRARAASKSFDGYTSEVPDITSPPITVRVDFNPTALFAPLVKTGKDGLASVPFKLPDNLTRYRLVALVTDGGQRFGKGESALLARLPLMVRPSPPRFLNFGDSFELPVVLQNQTDQEMDVQVGARAANLKFSGARGYRLKIPANDRVEVRFPAATDRAGKVTLQVGAVGPGQAADAAELSLPVWTPATTEAFATYGEIDEGAIAQPIKAPADVFPQFGGLEVTTTSTALQSLTDAFLYLTSYPFDCSEQVSSRLLGIAALRDVLWAFQAEGMPSASELTAQVQRDMERLEMLQLHDGGFGFWATTAEAWPYISVHVAHAITRAKEKGYKVPETMLSRSRDYLGNVESHIPHWYPEDSKRVIRAYALYVRHRLGDTDKVKADALIREARGVTKLPMEAMGFLYSVIAKDPDKTSELAEIRKHLQNSVTETAGKANFTAGYKEESGYVILASDRRVDGILLEALIKDQPKSDLIPKLARGLLDGRKKGRWTNTQDNVFVLLALDLYFQTYEKATPDFVARAWLGEGFVGEHEFRGRKTDYKSSKIPMSSLVGKGESTLTLSKQGQGRLYYRLGMDYAPKSLQLGPADHGFAIEREYAGVDNPDDVVRDEDGTWRIKAGSKVKVKLTMVAPARRYHVALVDPLPAGLEPMNPALTVTGSVPNDPSAQASRGPWWYWQSTWYEHQNLRDERVEAFTSLLWEGVYNYSYVARATTPGTFVVPPTKAEEMYAPETFGRSASAKVVVE